MRPLAVIFRQPAHDTRRFARLLGLEPKRTAIRILERNGMEESFVKMMKRDYISVMPRSDARTVVQNLAMAFEHNNRIAIRTVR